MGFWELNLQFLTILAEHRTALFDWFFAGVTWLGAEYVVVAVLAIYYLLIDKKTAYKLGCSFMLSSVIVQFVKIICRIPRPWDLIRDHPVEGNYRPLNLLKSIDKATGYSFPSGHSQSAAALYGFLAVRSKRWWQRVLWCLLAAAVCFSRLYLGVHTPFDVIVAVLIAIGCLIAVEALFDRWYDTKLHFVIPLFVGAVSLITTFVALDLFDVGWFGDQPKMCYDALKVAALGTALPAAYLIERNFVRFDPKEGGTLRKALRLICAVGGTLGSKELVKLAGKLIFGRETVGIVFVSHFIMIPFAMLAVPLIERLIVGIYVRKKSAKAANDINTRG